MDIENITDQLLGFTEEVEEAVSRMKEKGYSVDQAIKIVELGIRDIEAEVKYHKNKRLERIAEAIENLTIRIEEE